MENLSDMHHVPFVHRATIPGAGTRVEMQEARLDGAVIRMKVRCITNDPAGCGRLTTSLTRFVYQPSRRSKWPEGYSLSPARRRSIATIRGCGRDTDRTIFQDGWAAGSSRGWLRVRHGVGVHQSGHTDARKPAAQQSRRPLVVSPFRGGSRDCVVFRSAQTGDRRSASRRSLDDRFGFLWHTGLGQ